MQLRPLVCLLTIVLLVTAFGLAQAQTFTYHLHDESSATAGLRQLKTNGPDKAVRLLPSGVTLGSIGQTTTMSVYDLPANTPNLSGVVPKGTTITFILWMRMTAARGTVYPEAEIWTNFTTFAPGQQLCSARGTTPLTTTLAPYTISCVTTAAFRFTAANKLTVWPEYFTSSFTPGKGKNGGMSVEFGIEGVLNGSADSRLTMVVPPDPRISGLSPTVGAGGTTVAVSGVNFGATQGTSRLLINSLEVIPVSWGASQIVATVPEGVDHGPVQVVMNGKASNKWMFIGQWGESSCEPTVSPARLPVFPAAGADRPLSVAVAPTCAWTVASLPAWLTASPMSGTGSATVTITAAAHSSNQARTEDFAINGVPVGVIQEGVIGAPLFWIKTLAPPSITELNGVATCSVDVDASGTATPVFVGMSLFLGNNRIASSRNAGSLFTLQASAPVPVGYTPLLSCAVYAIDEGFVVADGIASSSAPNISRITPSAGLPGTIVTIEGSNFGSTQDISLVAFGGTYAEPASWSANALQVPVPDGATSGPVRVIVAGQISNAAFYEDLSSAQQCVPQFSSTSLVFAPAGGTQPLTISTEPDCPWSIVGLPSWLSADVPGGVGSVTINLSTGALPGSDPRGGSFTVNGAQVEAIQSDITSTVSAAGTSSAYGDLLFSNDALACTGFINTGHRYRFFWSGIAVSLDGQILGSDSNNISNYMLHVLAPYQVAPYDRVATCVAYTIPDGRILWQQSVTIPGAPSSCGSGIPPINKKGFRPGTNITYSFVDTGGTNGAWTNTEKSCVEQATTNWSAANTATGLNVTFSPVAAGQPVTFTFIKAVLPLSVGGNTPPPTLDAQGFIVGSSAQITRNTNQVQSCIGFKKAALHEIGHSMGFADHTGRAPITVMNQMGLKDDSLGQMASQVTQCDASQAFQAQFHP